MTETGIIFLGEDVIRDGYVHKRRYRSGNYYPLSNSRLLTKADGELFEVTNCYLKDFIDVFRTKIGNLEVL